MVVADREGFEPSVRFHVHTLSKRARSTTPPPVRFHDVAVQPPDGRSSGARLIEQHDPLGKRPVRPHMGESRFCR